jgi:hypothetical protein
MRSKKEIVAEIHRIAKLLGADRVSQNDFEKHGSISVSGVTYVFGSWNRAIKVAGLETFEPTMRAKVSDDELMQEVIRLTRHLGKAPSDRKMASFGRFSPKPYVKRWGTFVKGRTAAYDAFGFPDVTPIPKRWTWHSGPMSSTA